MSFLLRLLIVLLPRYMSGSILLFGESVCAIPNLC
jgi:hypothetical protein